MILREDIILRLAGSAEVHTKGEVIPLRTDEMQELDRTPETVSYRLILAALDPSETPTAADEIEWRGSNYALIGPPLKYTANGKLHHLEAFITRGTG